MKQQDAKTGSEGPTATGLPVFHTWRGVYLFVLGSFFLWVALLFALTIMFR
jgi:hypothetical protein